MKQMSHLSKEDYMTWEAPSEEEMMKMRDEVFAENGKWYYQAVWEAALKLTTPTWQRREWKK